LSVLKRSKNSDKLLMALSRKRSSDPISPTPPPGPSRRSPAAAAATNRANASYVGAGCWLPPSLAMSSLHRASTPFCPDPRPEAATATEAGGRKSCGRLSKSFTVAHEQEG